jgi:hypothetical protein
MSSSWAVPVWTASITGRRPGAGDQGLRRHTALGEQVLQLVNEVAEDRVVADERCCG